MLVTRCYLTNYPKIQGLKTVNIYSLTMSTGQKFRSSLVEYLWLRVSRGATVWTWVGAAGLPGTRASAFRMAHSVASPHHANLSVVLPSGLITWQVAPPRLGEETTWCLHNAFYDFASERRCHHVMHPVSHTG